MTIPLVAGSMDPPLLEAASGADLLVVPGRGRHGHLGLRLGLINHAVPHHTPCPIAVVAQIRLPPAGGGITPAISPWGTGRPPTRDLRPL